MSGMTHKIRLDHLQHQAYIYIRQSTLQQVHHHQESGRRQYALQEQAVLLGWPQSALVVVDEDQGQSGQKTDRVGLQRLMEAVSRGEVGAIFCLEVSRLARRSSAWHTLIELCAWQNTLLIDEESVYDPTLANDRLILGIRGLIDENELETLRRRMQVSREEKAQRGKLRIQPPTGFVYDHQGGMRMDPDEEVRGTIRLFFEQFHHFGNAGAVVCYFNEHNLRFPTRYSGGVREGEVEWKPLNYGRTLYVLHDPIYAGAYTYGRHAHSRQRKPREKQEQGEVRLPPDQWLVLKWGAFPGYIRREEYEANQQRLAENRPAGGKSGRTRMGMALLSGRVICGCCGRPMRVVYEGTNGEYVTYVCNPWKQQGQYHTCQRVPGDDVDRSVAQAVLTALTPAEIGLSLQILDELARQNKALQKQWNQRLERAHYEVDVARRRYQQVEPENRLVVRTLEREWEECLAALAQTEQEYAHAQKESALVISEADRERLLALAQDLPVLWKAETTTVAERKEVIGLLIADVTLTRQATDILVQLRWSTNEVDTWVLPLPHRGARTDLVVLESIREIAATHTDAEIAAHLNAAGRHTAHGKPFTAALVHGLRREHQIVKVRKGGS
jgi:DNA invertase Pin-like site-specific DNA recombinase